jgi:hypothetical protein
MVERLVIHYRLRNAMMNWICPMLLCVDIGNICRWLSILAGLLAMAQEVLKILYRSHA